MFESNKNNGNSAFPSVVCPAGILLKEAGVRVTLESDRLTREPGQCLGEVQSGRSLRLSVLVNKRRNLSPVVAYGHQDEAGATGVQVLRSTREYPYQALFNWNVLIQGYGKAGYPSWPQNRLYILIEAENGRYQLFLVGAFAQNNQVWCWAELATSGQLTRDEGGVSFETRSPMWDGLLQALVDMDRYKRRILYQKPTEEQTPMAVTLQPDEYVVQFWNPFMGFGWAMYEDAEGMLCAAKVHHSALKDVGPHGLRRLEAGDLVTGTLTEGTHIKGAQKGEKRLELKEVKLIKK